MEKAKRQKIKGKLIEKPIEEEYSLRNEDSTKNTHKKIKQENPTKAKQSLSKVNLDLGNQDNKQALLKKEPIMNAKARNLSDISEQSLRRVVEVKQREPLSAHLKHQVYLKDQGRCSYKDKNGGTCSSSRFLEIHHIKPVSQGGLNTLENLTLLCHGHHKAIHYLSLG